MRIMIVLRLPDDVYEDVYASDTEFLAEDIEDAYGGTVETIKELRDE